MSGNVLLRLRQARDPRHQRKGAIQTLRDVVRHKGVRGLYQGFTVSSLNVVVGQLYITCFEYLRSDARLAHALGPYNSESTRNAVAGAVAVTVSQCVGNPVYVGPATCSPTCSPFVCPLALLRDVVSAMALRQRLLSQP